MRLPNERIAAMLLLTAAAVPMTHARAQDWTPPRLHENKKYSHAWIDVDGVKTHYVRGGTRSSLCPDTWWRCLVLR